MQISRNQQSLTRSLRWEHNNVRLYSIVYNLDTAQQS